MPHADITRQLKRWENFRLSFFLHLHPVIHAWPSSWDQALIICATIILKRDQWACISQNRREGVSSARTENRQDQKVNNNQEGHKLTNNKSKSSITKSFAGFHFDFQVVYYYIYKNRIKESVSATMLYLIIKWLFQLV